VSRTVPHRAAETPEPKAGDVNPALPPASLTWALRVWNWIVYGNQYGPQPAPTPPPPAPDEEQPTVTLIRHERSRDDLPAVPTDQTVYVGFTNRLHVEGPVRDC
jgi:hypothetical protein